MDADKGTADPTESSENVSDPKYTVLVPLADSMDQQSSSASSSAVPALTDVPTVPAPSDVPAVPASNDVFTVPASKDVSITPPALPTVQSGDEVKMKLVNNKHPKLESDSVTKKLDMSWNNVRSILCFYPSNNILSIFFRFHALALAWRIWAILAF